MYKNRISDTAALRDGGRMTPLRLASAGLLVLTAAALAAGQAQGQHRPPPGMEITAAPAVEDKMLGAPPSEPIRREIEDLVTAEGVEARLEGEVGHGAMTAIRQAYARHVFEPIWTRKGAFDFYDAVASNFDRGLVVEAVTLQALDGMIRARFGDGPERAAEADVELTTAFVRLAALVSGGLSDEGKAVRPRRHGPNRALLTELIMRAGAGDADAALGEVEPGHSQYDRLKDAMKHYREIAAAGGWPAIPQGELVYRGQRDPRIPALRERLAAEGFHALGQTPGHRLDRLDWQLAVDLKEFQRRHGLKPDGVVGPNTLEALNESVESKLDRIADAMHRWRLQGDMGRRHLWVNVPSFTAEGWNDGHREISMKTIVGRPDRRTPVFSDQVEYVVTNPEWNVPVSIARKDKLPRLQRDPGYARRGNYKVFDRETGDQVSPYNVNWHDPESAERYKIVQGPGDANALGRLKIIFPNQYSVYMHDTPDKHLFEEAQRAFSSGCVRLQRPVAMARWIAGIDPQLSDEEIEEKLASRENDWMPVKEPVPVHITYITVTVDDQGRAHFWRDIYDRQDGIRAATRMAPLHAPHSRNISEAPGDFRNNG
ncbi:L,D-transpeptidase family protein [Minwuia thermotolerans]|uniref:L,D-TPase catalytic domain-containing protein n=1 Tax=Minwuia thermotolerans TaxID=2056226 RepID=A0A2M9FZD9_9PROT|nr:L,D-transpeptidase family protein [Minwuia thermotolerans]PJK28820.1 hypothetical protein CVT23_15945 [Minwuia thermotolerans]